MSDNAKKNEDKDLVKLLGEKSKLSKIKKTNLYLLSNTHINDTPFAMAQELKEKAKGLN